MPTALLLSAVYLGSSRMILACIPVAAGLIVATDGLVGLTKKG